MTNAAAAQLLEVPVDATPEQIEARFLELRRKLEDRIAKAPTPGLQAKYRASLTEITNAFETLMVAADSSLLPVLKQEPVSAPPPAAAAPASAAHPQSVTPPPATRPTAPARNKKSNTEFIVVALLAVVLLGAGGWWVLKTREEKAAQARQAAEAAAAAQAAEAKRQQEAAAEEDRLARLSTQLRTRLAEARVTWEAYESDLRDSERRVSELKSELRSFRDGSAERKAELSAQAAQAELFTNWFKAYLVRHPSKVARARAEQFLDAKSTQEAEPAVVELETALGRIAEAVDEWRQYLFNTKAIVRLQTEPAGLAYRFTDAYGRVSEGRTPAELKDVPLTHVYDPTAAEPTLLKLGEFTAPAAKVTFLRTGWAEQTAEVSPATDDYHVLRAEFPQGKVMLDSQPRGVPFEATNDRGWRVTGKTPMTVEAAPPGIIKVKLTRSGFQDVAKTVEIKANAVSSLSIDQRSQTVKVTVAEPEAEIWVDGKFVARKEATLVDYAPGKHQLELRHPKWKRYRTEFTTKQEATSLALNYSFAQLTALAHTCNACSGRGQFVDTYRCGECSGRGSHVCSTCKGRGYNTWEMLGNVQCSYCKGSGREQCFTCEGSGKGHNYRTCDRCSGAGRLSTLQLSP